MQSPQQIAGGAAESRIDTANDGRGGGGGGGGGRGGKEGGAAKARDASTEPLDAGPLDGADPH
eukprot:4806406-Pyramimonas_sp.AAC.1